jgi:hypothetical protein
VNRDALMLNELHSVFGNDTEIVTLDTVNGGTLSCNDNRVIIWGYHIQYHHKNADNNCVRNNNKVCTVGQVSCSVPDCAMESSQSKNRLVGRLVLLCGHKTLTDSYTKSVVVTNHQAADVTCDGDDKIMFGFKYQYSSTLAGCPASNFGACDIGEKSCAIVSQSFTACAQPTAVANILCAPGAMADLLQSFGAIEAATDIGATPTKLSCPPQNDTSQVVVNGTTYGPRSTLLTGVTLSLADMYWAHQASALGNANSICSYGQDCDRLPTTSRGQRLEGGFAVCVPGVVTESPTTSPSGAPSLSPSLSPTKSPTQVRTLVYLNIIYVHGCYLFELTCLNTCN